MIRLNELYNKLKIISSKEELYAKALELNPSFKMYYFKSDKEYYFLVLNNYLFDYNFYDSPKKYDDLNSIFINMKNKIIMSIEDYNVNTKIELYEYSYLKPQLIEVPQVKLEINQNNFLKKINNKVLLTQNEIDLLLTAGIDATKYASLDDIIYDLDEILNDEDYEELEYLLTILEERKYYEQTHK